MSADRRWTLIAYGYGALLSAVLGYFMLGLVVQVSDSFGNLLAVQKPTLAELLRDQFSQRAYLRPLLWAQIKLVYDLSGGQYYDWFRGIHVVQVVLLVGLTVSFLRPQRAADVALVPLSLAVLTGAHTFAPMVREAFPINSFLTIAICVLATAVLAARDRSRWYTDVLVIVMFVGAVLTVESGILIWVVCAGAALLKMQGISRRALVVMTVALGLYVVVRMLVFNVGTPSLAERASGFGFGVLEPSELIARFEGRPWGFYVYNVISSFSTVLFSEPKGGVWRFIYELTLGSVHPWTAVSVASSAAGTVLVLRYVWMRRQQFRTLALEHGDRVVALFVIVLAANAALSFPYTKNVIMGPAGVFFAAAVYVAARSSLDNLAAARSAVPIAAVMVVLSFGWAFREVGTLYNLRRTAAEQRAEWVTVDQWLERQRLVLQGSDARTLRNHLQRDAIWAHPTPSQPTSAWKRWFDIDW
jgi:hypothetical protein